jgi:hypothetical protein
VKQALLSAYTLADWTILVAGACADPVETIDAVAQEAYREAQAGEHASVWHAYSAVLNTSPCPCAWCQSPGRKFRRTQ